MLCSNVGCDVTVCSLEKQGVEGETREGETGGECHQSSPSPLYQVLMNIECHTKGLDLKLDT